MQTRAIPRVLLALAVVGSILTAIAFGVVTVRPQPAAASSAALYAYTGGSNPSLPNFTPPSTDGVDDSTGQYFTSATDISVPGLGPALDLTRTYVGPTPVGPPSPSLFGPGWTFSYGMSIIDPLGSEMTIVQENGSPVTFGCTETYDKHGNPSWTCDPYSGQSDVSVTVVNSHDIIFTRGLERFTFSEGDEDGPLVVTSISDANGRTTTLNWGGCTGILCSVTDAEGRSISFTYNSLGLIASATDPLGRVTHYAYNSNDELTSVTQPGGQTTSFTYDDSLGVGLLSSITDPNGGTTTLALNSCSGCNGDYATSVGSVASLTDPIGLVTTFTYGDPINPVTGQGAYTTTITDPNGVVTTDAEELGFYSQFPNQIQLTVDPGLGSSASVTTYTFNPNGTSGGQPLTVTDPDNHTTTYTYGSTFNPTSITDPMNQKSSFTWNSFGEVLTAKDPLGILDTNTYDSYGNLTKRVLTADSTCTSNCTQTTTYTVCESATCTVGSNHYLLGETESMTDAKGDVTNYTYDSYGDVATTTTNPSTGVTNTTQDVFDADGDQVCQASPDAFAASTKCPAAGQPRVSGTTTSVYNSDGQLSSTTDADGNTTSYAYDGDGNQTTVTDGLGNVTKTGYDLDDRTTAATEGYGTSAASTTSYTYNLSGSSCPSAPSGYQYCTKTTDGLGNATLNYFNGLNQLIETAPPNTTAQAPTSYTYDAADNLLTTNNGAGTTSYTYNADNLETAISYSNTQSGFTQPHSVSYAYDADGSRTQMVDGTGTTTYAYDGFERIKSVQNGAGSVVTYGYDLDNDTTCLSYPNSGSTTCQNATSGTGLVSYVFNGAGEETQMTDWLGNGTGFTYDHDGDLVTTTLSTGTNTSVSYTFDPTDALTDTSVVTSGSRTDLDALTRNADKLIASTTPSAGPATTYGYDPLNRVTGGSAAIYTYDAASEITSVTPSGGTSTDYAYNADEQLCWTGASSANCGLPPVGATTYTYNLAGERTGSLLSSGATTSYAWDQAGDLVCETAGNTLGYSCADPNSSVTSTYSYDGTGLRMSDTPASGSAQTFTWNELPAVPALLGDGSNYYLYGPMVGSAPTEQINRTGAPAAKFLVSDSTGVRELLSSSGSVVGQATYDSYGNPCSGCSLGTPFGFTGGESDGSGLIYLINRYYDPVTGQFLSVDPDVARTHEPYVYTGGDPVNAIDPLGTDDITEAGDGAGPPADLIGPGADPQAPSLPDTSILFDLGQLEEDLSHGYRVGGDEESHTLYMRLVDKIGIRNVVDRIAKSVLEDLGGGGANDGEIIRTLLEIDGEHVQFIGRIVNGVLRGGTVYVVP